MTLWKVLGITKVKSVMNSSRGSVGTQWISVLLDWLLTVNLSLHIISQNRYGSAMRDKDFNKNVVCKTVTVKIITKSRRLHAIVIIILSCKNCHRLCRTGNFKIKLIKNKFLSKIYRIKLLKWKLYYTIYSSKYFETKILHLSFFFRTDCRYYIY